MVLLLALFSLLLGQNAHAFYNPTRGVWPSRDPIGEDGGKNLYGFVRNDSVNFFDRLGQDVWVLRSPSWPGHEWIIGENGDGTYWDASLAESKLTWKALPAICASCF